MQFYCILVKNTTFYSNFVNFSLNVTKFGMLIPNIEIDMSHELGCYETHLAGNYEFLSYRHVRIYKLGWCSINTLASVLKLYISLERAGHQHSNKVYRICIAAMLRKIWTSM